MYKQATEWKKPKVFHNWIYQMIHNQILKLNILQFKRLNLRL